MTEIACFIDGASRNKGPNTVRKAACAAVIFKDRVEEQRFARGVGDKNNNEAEFEALIHVLLILSSGNYPVPTIYCDSETVVKHVNKQWQLKKVLFLPYLKTILEIRAVYPFNLVQVPRKKVFLPDQLCRDLLDELEEEEERILIEANAISTKID